MESADDGGVHCELASTEQWEAIHNYLKPPVRLQAVVLRGLSHAP